MINKSFVVQLLRYLIIRISGSIVLAKEVAALVATNFTHLKFGIVSRMFWGRGSMYKNAFHLAIALISTVALLTGIATRIRPAVAQAEFLSTAGLFLDTDSLHQGASIRSVTPLDPNQSGFQAQAVKHVVVAGEDVGAIADKYQITADTVRWANISLIGPFSNYLEPGWELDIPKVNGILHTVREGETLEQIVALTQANLFEVREINDLEPPEYAISAGQRIFIPAGNPYVWDGELDQNMLVNAFEDPLSHPACNGYLYYGGYTGTHNGIDLVIGGGCPIRAVAAGLVIHAGWWGMGGNTVIIDHGAGIKTHYYHGEQIWVRQGDRVSAGQDIMYMGNTGNSTGTHLHFSIFKNGASFDPAPYVPYKIRHPY